MAVELVNRQVAALVTGGTIWATISAKAATATIPIVFTTGSDPVALGYVASINRPGGNVTGVSFLAAQLLAKRLELASQLVPKDAVIGFLGRPRREPRYAADKKQIETAAAALENYCFSMLRMSPTSSRRLRLLCGSMSASLSRITIPSLTVIAAPSLLWRRAMLCPQSMKRAILSQPEV